jgi:hypothetical protein
MMRFGARLSHKGLEDNVCVDVPRDIGIGVGNLVTAVHVVDGQARLTLSCPRTRSRVGRQRRACSSFCGSSSS